MNISRRRFISLSSIIVLPYFNLFTGNSREIKPEIINFLDFSDSALIVGKYCSETCCYDISIDNLIKSMPPLCSNRKLWHTNVKNQIYNDFDINNVIQLQGWILANTEVNLASLTWLLYKKYIL